jgi:hypothetical protein
VNVEEFVGLPHAGSQRRADGRASPTRVRGVSSRRAPGSDSHGRHPAAVGGRADRKHVQLNLRRFVCPLRFPGPLAFSGDDSGRSPSETHSFSWKASRTSADVGAKVRSGPTLHARLSVRKGGSALQLIGSPIRVHRRTRAAVVVASVPVMSAVRRRLYRN